MDCVMCDHGVDGISLIGKGHLLFRVICRRATEMDIFFHLSSI
jgi:hypothetical protein